MDPDRYPTVGKNGVARLAAQLTLIWGADIAEAVGGFGYLGGGPAPAYIYVVLLYRIGCVTVLYLWIFHALYSICRTSISGSFL